MPSRSYYLRQSELLRALAACAGPERREQELQRANAYFVLAMSLPDDGYTPFAAPVTKAAQQPTADRQQQFPPDKEDPDIGD